MSNNRDLANLGTGFTQSGASAITRTVDSKLRDVVSVKDFGAVGDGSFNDATAIQAAFDAASGKTVFFPSGQYLINTLITTASNDIVVDFGSAAILNTVSLATSTIYGETSNAIFNFTGQGVTIHGGYFKDGLSEAIRITGVFAGGDTYIGTGYTKGHRVSGITFDNWAGNSIQIRFFNSAKISDIIVRPKGSGSAGHSPEIALKYGTDGQISNCSILDNNNGGAIYGLYVKNMVVANCYANVKNSTDAQSAVGYYYSFCDNVTTVGCQGYAMQGGLGYKGSKSSKLNVSSCRFENAGTGTNPYACIFMQGVDDFLVNANYLKAFAQHAIRISPHDDRNSRNGILSNNDIATAVSGTSRTTGDGIFFELTSSLTRGGLSVIGNRLLNASIYIAQAGGFDVPTSSVKNNTTIFTEDPANAAIWTDRCVGMDVSDNYVYFALSTTVTRTGVRNSSGSWVNLRNNYVAFNGNGLTGSTAYLQDGSPTANTVYWEENQQMRAAVPFSGMGTVASRTLRPSSDYGNAGTTLFPGYDPETAIWNTPLSGTRTVTLSTTGAFNGARFRIVRTAAATGAFNLDVGTGPLKSLAAGQWCDVIYNGNTSAWMLIAFGSL